jgi:hypothetical protein
MDTLTVVLQMTGLLLLVPPNPGSNGTTHVLAPRTDSLPRHSAFIAYVAPSGERCPSYNEQTRICIVPMAGYFMELGTTGADNDEPVGKLHKSGNLTLASGKRVPGEYHGERPGAPVRSRISLHSGEIAETCSMATWRYDPLGPTTPTDTFPLYNMVEWRIRDVPRDRLVLVRRRLNAPAGNAPGTADTLARPLPDSSGVVWITLMHVPPGEAANFRGFATGVVTRSRFPVTKDHAMRADAPYVASHFNAYYRLLGAGPNERPLPHYVGYEHSRCSVVLRPGMEWEVRRALETLSCMVAVAERQ